MSLGDLASFIQTNYQMETKAQMISPLLRSIFNFRKQAQIVLGKFFCLTIVWIGITSTGFASHGEAPISDVDHIGMGTFSGNYIHSTTDHVWVIFYAQAGDVINISASTPGWLSYGWLYRADDCMLEIGDSESNGKLIHLSQSYFGNSGTLTHTTTCSGKFAFQLDSYVGGSGAYTLTLSGAIHQQQTFAYTGSSQSWTVPANVYCVRVQAWGAQGADVVGIGGKGGYSNAYLAVTPGQILHLYVGGQGCNNPNYDLACGGFNGGGHARGGPRGGGGGASDVRIGGTNLTDRKIVAGGGGGACEQSYFPGGNAGGFNGAPGGTNQPGQGGTQIAGGDGFMYNSGVCNSGSFGFGGDAGYGTCAGGGGGWYGGGSGCGGGGGSSYVGSYFGGSTIAGVQSGDGQIIIQYVECCISNVSCRDVTITNLCSGNVTINGLGPTPQMLPAQLKGVGFPCTNVAAATDVVCNCPTGYVVTGYQADYGNGWGSGVISKFRLRCREVMPDGNFGTNEVWTCYNGTASGSTTDVSEFAAPGHALVGFQNRMGCAIDRITGRSKAIIDILAGLPNATNTTLSGVGGFGGGLKALQLVPDGHVIIGMQTYLDPPNGISGGYSWKYATLTDVMKATLTMINACGSPTITLSKTSFGPADSGVNSVTATVSNTCYTTTCTFNVTVNDPAPSIICPPDMTVVTVPGECSAAVCYPYPTVSDNCAPNTPAGYTYKTKFGNSYYYQQNALSNYNSAFNNAIAAGGHLASITSSGENTAISSSGAGFAWIGGNDADVEGTWKWNNCETFSYTNWCGGEPNGGTAENYLEMEIGGCFNDLLATASRYAILEMEGAKIERTSGLAQNAVFPLGVTTIGFKSTDNNGTTSTCNLKVTLVAGSCGQPIQVYHIDTTTSSAKIKWKAGTPCNTGYQLRIRYEISPGVWSSWSSWVNKSGPGNEHSYTGLTSDTYYHYQIRSKCGSASNSINVNGWFHTLDGGALRKAEDDIVYGSHKLENYQSLPTSNVELTNVSIKTIPNPAKDFVNIVLDGFDKANKTLSMMDLLGKQVFRIQVPANENDLELDLLRLNLANGAYIIHLDDGVNRKTVQLVVQR